MEENVSGKKKKSGFKTEVYDWIQCLVTALVACILIFLFVGQVIGVEGGSMYPTLHDKDKVIIYGLGDDGMFTEKVSEADVPSCASFVCV